MNDRQFDDALDRYGGDLAKWPDRWRRTALEWVERSPSAAARLAAARALDAFVKTNDPAATVDDVRAARLVDRVVGRLGRQVEEPVRLGDRVRHLLTVKGLVYRYVIPAATAAVLGGLVGADLPTYSARQTDQWPVVTLISSARTTTMGF
jgi:hypothetical protein